MKKYVFLTFLVIALLSSGYAQSKIAKFNSREFVELSIKGNKLLDECISFDEAVGIAAGIYKDSNQRWFGAYISGEQFESDNFEGPDALSMFWFNRNLRIYKGNRLQ